MNSEKTQIKPNIFEYTNYRLFLKDTYVFFKATTSSFSFRYFSNKAGFGSPNFYKLVMENKRNLSKESIPKFTKTLKLNKQESLFFKNLVLLNQSENVKDKEFYSEQILKNKAFQKIYPLSQKQYDYLSKWYIIPIREMIALKSFCEDAKWIAHQLTPNISSKDAKKALELLKDLKLIQKNKDGQLEQTNNLLSTGDKPKDLGVSEFHIQMLERAKNALLTKTEPKDISSVTLALSEEAFLKIQNKIRKFRKDLLAIADSDHSPERIYQLNFQIFPLTDKNPKD